MISLKTNKAFASLIVLAESGTRLAASTFWDLNFPAKPCGNTGYRGGETTW